jgi:hypothetical protein
MNSDAIFAIVVGVLAALAVIGALVFAIVWEVCAIRRMLDAHRRMTGQTDSYWRNRTA